MRVVPHLRLNFQGCQTIPAHYIQTSLCSMLLFVTCFGTERAHQGRTNGRSQLLLFALQSIVYPVDDVLLPSVVTIPLSAALANYNQTSNNPYSPAIADKVSVLDKLQKDTANGAPAPIYLAPATPPTPGQPRQVLFIPFSERECTLPVN